MKVYRYRSGRYGSAFALVVALGICVALIANDLGVAMGRGSEGLPLSIILVPLLGVLGWAVFASRWICRVELEDANVKVFNVFGKPKVFDLKQPFQMRIQDGESALVIELAQGGVKARIHEFIEDFRELREKLRMHGSETRI